MNRHCEALIGAGHPTVYRASDPERIKIHRAITGAGIGITGCAFAPYPEAKGAGFGRAAQRKGAQTCTGKDDLLRSLGDC
jgi:hypothetical protein